MPCADNEVYSAAHIAIEKLAVSDSHSHDKDKDLCPPFCACNCCGAQILGYSPFVVLEFPLTATIISSKSTYYKSIFSSNFFGSIWQPPQIV